MSLRSHTTANQSQTVLGVRLGDQEGGTRVLTRRGGSGECATMHAQTLARGRDGPRAEESQHEGRLVHRLQKQRLHTVSGYFMSSVPCPVEVTSRPSSRPTWGAGTPLGPLRAQPAPHPTGA